MNARNIPLAEGILYTDEYQLTMAQVYFHNGLHETPAMFDHFFRSYPDYGMHQAGYCINAGLAWLLEWMNEAHFDNEAIEYLRGHTGSTGKRLFNDDFLNWLKRNGSFEGITLRAIPEGRVVHPNMPLTIVQGPLAMVQILETPLLNKLNFQTLIATKAARIRESGRGQLTLEFGMRRAQDRGANAGARAALIGGADYTSNVGASWVLGFPPKGTHAHSMVQAFMAYGGTELDAFRAYAEVFPDDCLLLVDTIDTLESGVPNAIKVFEELKQKGHKPMGIRLDSGDLAYLAIHAARMLNNAGFSDARIVLSNQLDELVIWQIITQILDDAESCGVDPEQLINRLVYGVGTRLITSAGSAALDGVYKLVALKKDGDWEPAIKISETPSKTLLPGEKRVYRLYDRRDRANADIVALEEENIRSQDPLLIHHPSVHTKYRFLRQQEIQEVEPLLVDVLLNGKLVYDSPTIEEMREIRQIDIDKLDSGVKRLMNPHTYHVSVTRKLWDLKQELIREARRNGSINGDS